MVKSPNASELRHSILWHFAARLDLLGEGWVEYFDSPSPTPRLDFIALWWKPTWPSHCLSCPFSQLRWQFYRRLVGILRTQGRSARRRLLEMQRRIIFLLIFVLNIPPEHYSISSGNYFEHCSSNCRIHCHSGPAHANSSEAFVIHWYGNKWPCNL